MNIFYRVLFFFWVFTGFGLASSFGTSRGELDDPLSSASSSQQPLLPSLMVEDDESLSSGEEEPVRRKDTIGFKQLREINPQAAENLRLNRTKKIVSTSRSKKERAGDDLSPSDDEFCFCQADDEESDREEGGILHNGEVPSEVIDLGIRVKFLALVFQRNYKEPSNIFVPYVKYRAQGTLEAISPILYKNKICVFASGGLKNAWEKNVAKAYEALFGYVRCSDGMHRSLKIIRASWIQKHVKRDLYREYKHKSDQLHSELYYRWFAEKFPLIAVNPGNNLELLRVLGFSWWKPCDMCNGLLEAHRKISSLSYNIVYARPYRSTYLSNEYFNIGWISDYSAIEGRVWEELWQGVIRMAGKFPTDDEAEEKEQFWTNSLEGIEFSKWLGQAFVVEPPQKRIKKGDVTSYYQKLPEDERLKIKDLVDYLREKNWEFSCWEKKPEGEKNPKGIRFSWKKHWKNQVVPHFGWKVLESYHLEPEEDDAECEMCGNDDLRNFSFVFNSKHRFIGDLVALNEEELKKQQMKKSLIVGNDCMEQLKIQDRETAERLRREVIEKYARKAQEKAAKKEEDKFFKDSEKKARKIESDRKKGKAAKKLDYSSDEASEESEEAGVLKESESEDEIEEDGEEEEEYSSSDQGSESEEDEYVPSQDHLRGDLPKEEDEQNSRKSSLRSKSTKTTPSKQPLSFKPVKSSSSAVTLYYDEESEEEKEAPMVRKPLNQGNYRVKSINTRSVENRQDIPTEEDWLRRFKISSNGNQMQRLRDGSYVTIVRLRDSWKYIYNEDQQKKELFGFSTAEEAKTDAYNVIVLKQPSKGSDHKTEPVKFSRQSSNSINPPYTIPSSANSNRLSAAASAAGTAIESTLTLPSLKEEGRKRSRDEDELQEKETAEIVASRRDHHKSLNKYSPSKREVFHTDGEGKRWYHSREKEYFHRLPTGVFVNIVEIKTGVNKGKWKWKYKASPTTSLKWGEKAFHTPEEAMEDTCGKIF